MENNKCQTGCKFYTGGEIKHHKDCFYYPDSMSKIFDDMKAELKKLRVGDVIRSCNHENKTNYCNTDGSYSHKVCDDCNETLWD